MEMLTGTPLDLTPFGDLLGWAGNTIVLAWLGGAVWLAVSRAATRQAPREKWIAASRVLVVMIGIPMMLIGWQAYGAWREREAFRARYAVAEALFKKRCETAGEFIDKTVPDVKGVVWMKWRDLPKSPDAQFRTDDPFGHDCSRTDCIKELLVATEGANLPYQGEWLHPYGTGYEFVEAIDPADGRPYRFRLRLYRPHERDSSWAPEAVRSELLREPIASVTARYGLTWEDISSREDRENWIAGGSLSVVDLQAKKEIAVRVGYMMDPGLGSTAGFRSTWAFAGDHACPAKVDQTGKRTEVGFTRRFVFKVLQPIRGAK